MKKDKEVFNFLISIAFGLFFGIGISLLTIPLRENPYEYPAILRTLSPFLPIIPIFITQFIIHRRNNKATSLIELNLYGFLAITTFVLTYYFISYKILMENDSIPEINSKGLFVTILFESVICLFSSFLVKKFSKGRIN